MVLLPFHPLPEVCLTDCIKNIRNTQLNIQHFTQQVKRISLSRWSWSTSSSHTKTLEFFCGCPHRNDGVRYRRRVMAGPRSRFPNGVTENLTKAGARGKMPLPRLRWSLTTLLDRPLPLLYPFLCLAGCNIFCSVQRLFKSGASSLTRDAGIGYN